LVLPLSDPKITATTGFRWQYSKNGLIGEQVHSYVNNLLYVFFNFSATVLKVGLWGGSMAMRKADFEELKVEQRWAETAVDDMSLSAVIMKASKKSLLVSTCVTTTDDSLETVQQSINWFMRQVMFLKGYHAFTWMFVAIPFASFLLFLYLWLPVALVLSHFSFTGFMAMGGGASMAFVAGAMMTALLYPLVEKNPRFFGFFMLQPFAFLTMLVSVDKTLFTNTILWSGVRYTMSFKGRVTKIVRLPKKDL
jgi:hypothetical protein